MRASLNFHQYLLICLFLKGSTPAEEATHVEQKTIPFSQNGTLAIMAEDGQIQIDAWDREFIQFDMTCHAWGATIQEAEDRLDDLHVEIMESQNRVVLRETDNRESRNIGLFDILDGDFWKKQGWRDVQIDYILKVPKKIRLKLNLDTGQISIQGTEGPIHLVADEGRVQLSQIRSDEIRIELDEADVRLSDIAQQQNGLCQIVMDEGDIFCENVQTQFLEIQCDEGDISGEEIDVMECRVDADEGLIQFAIRPRTDGRYFFSTDEGDIHLNLPQSASIQLRLWTEEGRIQTDTDLTVRRFDDGEQLDGQLGNFGNAILKASSDEGDIRLSHD